MMRKFFIAIFAICLSLCGHAQMKLSGAFKLTIELKGFKVMPSKLYLWYVDDSAEKPTLIYDSTEVHFQTAVFKGMLAHPLEATLSSSPKTTKNIVPGARLFFYLEPEDIRITAIDSLDNYQLRGGHFNKEYREFKATNQFYNEKLNKLNPLIREVANRNSPEYLKALADYTAIFNKWIYGDTKRFISIFASSSPVSLLALRLYTGFDIREPVTADSLYKSLAPEFKEMPIAIAIKTKIMAALAANIGNQAPGFSAPDTAGKVVDLSSFRGKYVLLDFWASWCAPCRAENPNLIANFNKYKNRGFTILSVSLDREDGKTAWLNAIHQDKVGLWTHVSHLRMLDEPIAKLYGVSGVPQNFLIDPHGKIIAVNLKGDELTKKLSELFGK